jgi:ATPase subunit of ABC transporter with duplicated ATPase domains
LLNKLFEKTYWLEDGKLHHFTGNYSWARKKLDERKTQEEKRQEKVPPIKMVEMKNTSNEKEIEKLEKQLEEAESILAELTIIMEQENSLEKLQSYFEQQKLMEEKRDEIYQQLERFL